MKKSTVVESFEFNRGKGLIIEFTSGGKYLYKNVDEKTFEDFSEADSKGKFLNEVLKKDFKVERL